MDDDKDWAIAYSDVLFQMLIATVLLIGAQLPDQLAVHLPPSTSTDGLLRIEGAPLVLTITREGTVHHEGRAVGRRQLDALAQQAFERGVQEAVILADRNAPFEAYTSTLTILRAHAFTLVRLPIRRRSKPL